MEMHQNWGINFPQICPFSTKFDLYLAPVRKTRYNKAVEKAYLQELNSDLFAARAEEPPAGAECTCAEDREIQIGGDPMADFLSSNSMLMLERAMNFQWTKQRAIADNVVNAETPNYKTKYVTFEEALRKNIWSAAQQDTPLSSMRQAIGSTAPKVHVADDETARMDGNGVNVAEQQIELVRNAFQMQYVYRAISGDMSRLLMAIRGQ